MNRQDYFKQVIALYESANEKERLNEMGEVVNQSQIADTGSDVMAPQGQQMDPNMMQDPNAMPMDPGMDPNAGMMPQDPSAMEGAVPEDDSQVMEKQKFVKLYELYENLLDYGTAFIEALDSIDKGLLTTERLISVRIYTDNINRLNEKISNYMINIFNNEPYEKVLYAYIVFRTELVTNIKGIRDILILNKPEEPLPDQQENKKK